MENASSQNAVIVSQVRCLLDYLRDAGFDPAAIYGPPLLAWLDAADSAARMPLARWDGMFRRAVEYSGDESLPLKVGASIKARHYGMVGYVAMSCATLGEAIAMNERYERLVDDVSESQLLLSGETAEMLWLPVYKSPYPYLAQLSLAGLTTYARMLTERPDLGLQAHFEFAEPADLSVYLQIFGQRPLFGQPATKLVFPTAYLSLRIAHSDAEINQLLKTQAEAMLLQWAGEPEFLRELKLTLSTSLVSGRVALVDIAARLHLSGRTLQRRLDELGLSYQRVLDEVRRQQAEAHLKNPAISLAEVAFLLGYSEQSPFQNAFRRWLGESPGAYRKRLLRGG